MKKTLFLLLCFVPGIVLAQDFAVTAKGDTLRGKLKIISSGYDKRLQIADESKKKSTFPITQVKSFLLNGERYQTVRTANTYEFMKLLKEGYLSLYAFQVEKQMTYDGRYLVKKDGSGTEVPNLVFKKSLMKFLDNCPAVTAKIEDGTLGRNDLDAIIDQYNDCISQYSEGLKTMAVTTTPAINTEAAVVWDNLYKETEASSIESKTDVLDMITDIKGKVIRNERVPKFLVDGLRSSLSANSALATSFEKALGTIKQ